MYWQLIIIIILAGCAHRPIAKNIKSLKLSSNINEGKSSVLIEGDNCSYKILGNNVNHPPSAYKALLRDRNALDVKTFLNISIEVNSFNAVVYSEDCFTVKARGIK
jgi:hypothetical protein